jgi:hypothetical protein
VGIAENFTFIFGKNACWFEIEGMISLIPAKSATLPEFKI